MVTYVQENWQYIYYPTAQIELPGVARLCCLNNHESTHFSVVIDALLVTQNFSRQPRDDKKQYKSYIKFVHTYRWFKYHDKNLSLRVKQHIAQNLTDVSVHLER